MKVLVSIAIMMTFFDCGLGRASSGSFPRFPFDNVPIGSPKSAIERLDSAIQFVPLGGAHSVGVLKSKNHTVLFYLEDDKLTQVSYGWADLDHETQRTQTRQLAEEFTARFGKPSRSESERTIQHSRVTVHTLSFRVSPSEVAAMESWGKSITITVRSSQAHTTSDHQIGAEKKISADDHADQLNKPGVVSFGKARIKKAQGSDNNTSPKQESFLDYIKELEN